MADLTGEFLNALTDELEGWSALLTKIEASCLD